MKYRLGAAILSISLISSTIVNSQTFDQEFGQGDNEVGDGLQELSDNVTLGGAAASAFELNSLGRASSISAGALGVADVVYELGRGNPEAAQGSAVGTTAGLIYAPIGAAYGGAVGGALGSAIGSVVPVIGTATGAVVGTAVGSVLGGVAGTLYGQWQGEQETYRLLRETNPSKLPLSERFKATGIDPSAFEQAAYSANPNISEFEVSKRLLRELQRREGGMGDVFLEEQIQRLEAITQNGYEECARSNPETLTMDAFAIVDFCSTWSQNCIRGNIEPTISKLQRDIARMQEFAQLSEPTFNHCVTMTGDNASCERSYGNPQSFLNEAMAYQQQIDDLRANACKAADQ